MKKLFSLAWGCMLVMTFFLANFADAQEKVITWRMPSAWPPGGEVTAYEDYLGTLANLVEKRSNGRLILKRYPPDALVKIMEQFDAVSKGAVEIACSAGLYHAGKVPEAHVEFGLPFTFPYEKPEYAMEFIHKWRGGIVLSKLNEAYNTQGTHLIGITAIPAYGFMTKFPVSKVEDFKGKKMRTFGLFSILLTGLGSAPVSVPGAEQYMALQTGTIDGTVFPYYVIETYKLKEVIKYAVFPAVLGTPTINLYANLKEWNKLPDDLKKIMQEAHWEASVNAYIPRSWAFDKKVLTEIAPKAGVKTVTLPEEEVAKLMKLSEPLWKRVEGMTPRNAELISLLKEFLKEKGVKYPGG